MTNIDQQKGPEMKEQNDIFEVTQVLKDSPDEKKKALGSKLEAQIATGEITPSLFMEVMEALGTPIPDLNRSRALLKKMLENSNLKVSDK